MKIVLLSLALVLAAQNANSGLFKSNLLNQIQKIVPKDALQESHKLYFLVLDVIGTLICEYDEFMAPVTFPAPADQLFRGERLTYIQRPGLAEFITSLCGPNDIFYCVLYTEGSKEDGEAVFRHLNSICKGMIRAYASREHTEFYKKYTQSKNLELIFHGEQISRAIVIDDEKEEFYGKHEKQMRQVIPIEAWTNYVVRDRSGEVTNAIVNWRDDFLPNLSLYLRKLFDPNESGGQSSTSRIVVGAGKDIVATLERTPFNYKRTLGDEIDFATYYRTCVAADGSLHA